MDQFAVGYSLPFATFALVYDANGYCVDAPPIARWCIGRTQVAMDRYWAGRGAKIMVL